MFGKKKEQAIPVQAPQFVSRPEPQISLVIPEEQNNLNVEEAIAKVSIE